MTRDMIGSLVWAAGLCALAIGSTAARKLGYIDGDTVERIVIGATGLMFAWYGDRIPKTFTRHASGRRAQRVAAWSLVLSGLVYAGLWAFAPIPVASWCGAAALLTGVVVTFGYCLSLSRTMKAG